MSDYNNDPALVRSHKELVEAMKSPMLSKLMRFIDEQDEDYEAVRDDYFEFVSIRFTSLRNAETLACNFSALPWVCVEERLPDTIKDCVIEFQGGAEMDAYYSTGGGLWLTTAGCEVSHPSPLIRWRYKEPCVRSAHGEKSSDKHSAGD